MSSRIVVSMIYKPTLFHILTVRTVQLDLGRDSWFICDSRCESHLA